MVETLFEKQFIQFFDSSSMPFFFATAEGKRLFFNRAFCVLVGYSKEEIYTMDRSWLLPVECLAAEREKRESLYPDRIHQVVEKEYIRKDGSKVPVEVHLHVCRVKNEPGDEDLFYAFVVDKSESREIEKKQQEAIEALRVSEEKFSRAFEYLPNMVCITSLDGIYHDISAAFSEILGYSREDVIGKRSVDFGWLNAYDREKFRAELQEKGFVREMECLLKTKSGEIVDTLLSAVKLDIGGTPYILTALNDITQRNKMESALRESEERYRVLFEQSGDAIAIMDVESLRFTTVNPALLKMFDVNNHEELLELDFRDIVPKSQPDGRDSLEKAREMVENTLCKGSHLFEWTNRRKNGEEFTSDVLLSRINLGGMVFLQAAVRDTSKLKRAEAALRESEERYRVIFEQSRDAMLTLDTDSWRLTAANPAMLKMVGAENLEEFLALGFRMISPRQQPDGRSSREKALEMAGTAMREGSNFFEWTHRRLDGEEFPCAVMLSRVDLGDQVFMQATIRDISDIKRAEADLRASEEKFYKSFHNLPISMSISTLDGVYRDVNSNFLETSGFSREELIGSSALDRIWVNNEDRKQVMSELQQKGFLRNLEVPFYRKSGEIINGLMSAVIFNSGGTEYLLASVNDVTEQKRASEALAASEERYRRFMNTTSDMVFVKDQDFRYLIVNPKLSAFFGRPEEDIVGRTDFELMEPYAAEQCRESDLRARNRSTVSISEEVIGDRIYETHKFPISLGKDQVGIGAVIRDITERKKAELELSETRQQMANIINFLPDATLAIDLEGRVIAWNKAAEDMTGIKAEDMIGKSGYEYAIPFYGRRRPVLIDAVLAPEKEKEINYPSIERKGPTLIGESFCPALGLDGAFVRATASPLCDSHGNVVGAIESIRDATLQKKAEEQMKYLSLHDSLTGLYNRTYFEEEMLRLKSGRYNPVGIIICDVDGLKTVNDTLGHETGDILLVEAANVIKKGFRKGEVIARVGGDEFTVLIPKTDQEALEGMIRRIRANIDKYNNENPELPLSISIGYALTMDKGTSVYELFRQADNNMYREKLRRKQSTRSAIVQTLMKALGTRDFLTKGHAERLQNLTVALAKKIGLPENQINDLILLAQFHDIGKVGVSDSILFKNGPLTPEERREMQKHCEMGYHIALAAPDLAPIADWILKHQEWWDGKGYPLGIKGEDIPLECRILAIADAYDAMISDRPYRRAMSRKAALKELIRCSGTQFDPGLVSLFLEALGDGTF